MSAPPANARPDDRLLIFAPHPDDEVIGCGAVIAHGAAEGVTLQIVEVTSGQHLLTALANIDEPSPSQIGARREAETLRACGILGLGARHITFLGFEDGKVDRNAAAIEASCARIIADFVPTRIYCTSAWDDHPDHRATMRIVEAARHAPNGPAPVWQYADAATLARSGETFERNDIRRWYAVKRRAMEEFICHIGIVSPLQTKPVMPDFLQRYCSTEECFLVHP